MKNPRGITVPELLVSMFLLGLVSSMIASVLRLQQTHAYANEARLSSRKSIQLTFQSLEGILDATSTSGVHLAADGQGFSVQKIEGVSASGTRNWSPFLYLYRHNMKTSTLEAGRIDLSELGITHQPTLPSALTEDQLQSGFTILEANELFKSVAGNVESFQVSRPGPLTLELQITSLVTSGRYKSERVKGERKFFFASSADI